MRARINVFVVRQKTDNHRNNNVLYIRRILFNIGCVLGCKYSNETFSKINHSNVLKTFHDIIIAAKAMRRTG